MPKATIKQTALMLSIIFLNGCAIFKNTEVQIQYGKLEIRYEMYPNKNKPKTIEEVFNKKKKPFVDDKIVETLEMVTESID